jgi:hypothetical protein
MKIEENKFLQQQRLKELSSELGINFDCLNSLIDSVKTKKMLKRNNYYQQNINDIIEKEIK